METKKSTIYLDPDIHRVLRIKAIETDHSISELINEAVRLSLVEDAIDLAAFGQRKHEALVDFETAVKKLKQDGKI